MADWFEGLEAPLARELVEELHDCGHDHITLLDMLDALASCNLELVRPGDRVTVVIGMPKN